ncbi:TIGR01459 family HAD-type hydrolase [Labrenzia sp. PHM005]|uniref:TIGR01459 family HAD-type hydrolase n=1 Tax=Labrenzia sp. PHM005 TaxID=2590016 RepID=UPI0011402BA8|nr:TIGR01459 family HAD-type hydrolase [Labrenzia sp. PHM005]QDG79566.1 TIGR01459 family HAD-type hydrolase [Labrenzia sp. PHM005]
MTLEKAFAAYEAARVRLPEAQEGGRATPCGNLDDIADQFDVFLLDAFGVLNIGEHAIPGVPERVAGLQAKGKRVFVVTNAAGYSNATLMAKYARLGYDFAPENVISSRMTLLHALTREPKRYWGAMLSKAAGLADLENIDLTRLEEDRSDYAKAEGFLCLGAAEWTEERQALLEAALLEHPRPVLVANPDIVAPRENGFSTEPGSYAHRLADKTGVAPRFYGKPFANIYDLVFERLGGSADRSRIVMVGDSLHTDILGAQTAGVSSALISGYGFFAGTPIPGLIAQSGICPDYILDRP